MIIFDIEDNDIEIISNCFICEGGILKRISEVSLGELNFLTTAYCSQCGFVFRSKRPSEKWFKKAWQLRGKEEISFDKRLEGRRYFRYQNLAKAFEGITNGRKILDIGTGPGTGLRAFKDRSWQVVGLEPDLQRAKIAKKEGVRIVEATIQEYAQEKGSFDIITIVHTLEHIHYPKTFLSDVVKQVKPEGYVYIEVPDLNNFVTWKDSLYLEHMSNFSIKTLTLLASQIGLTPKYHFYPKTQPYGYVHLGVLFQKNPLEARKTPVLTLSKKQEQKIKQLYRKGLLFSTKDRLRFYVPEINDICMTMNNLNYPTFNKGKYLLSQSSLSSAKKLIGLLFTYKITETFQIIIRKTIKNKARDKGFNLLKFEPI
jgi:SAM-dependent methyltransferase